MRHICPSCLLRCVVHGMTLRMAYTFLRRVLMPYKFFRQCIVYMYKYTLPFVSLCINIHRNSVIPALFRMTAWTDANTRVFVTLRIVLSVSRLCFIASPDARSGVTEEPLSPARRGFTALPKSLRRVPATALPCCRKAFFAWRLCGCRAPTVIYRLHKARFFMSWQLFFHILFSVSQFSIVKTFYFPDA